MAARDATALERSHSALADDDRAGAILALAAVIVAIVLVLWLLNPDTLSGYANNRLEITQNMFSASSTGTSASPRMASAPVMELAASAHDKLELTGRLKLEGGLLTIALLDGFAPQGIENDEGIQWRRSLLRKIGYKS